MEVLSGLENRARKIVGLGLDGKQWLAIAMICALLLPVFSLPVSAAAPSTGADNSTEFEPVNDSLPIWTEAYRSLHARFEEAVTPWRAGNSEYSATFADDKKSAKAGTKEKVDATLNVEKSPAVTSEKLLAADTPKASALSASSTNLASKVSPPISAPPVTAPDELTIRESTYSPANNIGTPAHITELDSPNPPAAERIWNRTGVANYGFEVPFASLPGRGIDASVGMTYNSRVWNKVIEGTDSYYQYDLDKSWLAPGCSVGYGKLKSHFEARLVVTPGNGSGNIVKNYNEVIPEGYTDTDGTRHQFECKATAEIPGTLAITYDNTYCSEYGTTDGTFVKVLYHGIRPFSSNTTVDMSAYGSTFFTLLHTDGSKITYSAPGAQFGSTEYSREHYPIQIQDRNGNQIDIEYKDGKDNIELIRDTLGREIKFYYAEGTDKKLVAVTVPGYNGGAQRQTIRFYYQENVALDYQGRFEGYPSGPATIRTLKYVYFPGTGSGYRYDWHPNFGIITKITKLTGMTVSSNSLTETGTVGPEGTAAAATEYNYPNDGGDSPLTDVPRYNSRTDDWLGRTASTVAVTEYDSPEPATGVDRVSTVRVKDTAYDVDYKTVSYNTTDWKDGLPKETSVTRVSGITNTIVAKNVYTWIQGIADASGRKIPVVEKVETTNDAGQIRATTFTYDAYNNPTIVKEHDFAAQGVLGTELRRTETTYQTGTGWLNNRMFHLPTEIKTVVNGTTVSKVQYEYDNYTTNAIVETPDVIQHNPDYIPDTGVHECNCHYACDPGESPPNCPLECDECPNADPSTGFRANVTKVTSYSDATLTTDSNAIVNVMKYDMTGNVVEVSVVSCCNIKVLEYSAANQYAYVTKETKGSSPQLVNEAVYDFNTGLTKSVKNENLQSTYFTYDAATLRQTRVDHPNGAWTTTAYNDTSYPFSVSTTNSLDSTNSVQNYSYFSGRGDAIRSATQTPDGWNITAVDFDKMWRPIKTYNPFYAASPTAAVPGGTKFTEVTAIDALGRTTEVTFQDNTKVYSYPNEAAVTYTAPNTQTVVGTASRVKDQANKERRQIVDALGRVRRVDEPDSNGNLGTSPSISQQTHYEYDGNDNLSKVIQSDGTNEQARRFRYDSLSRLVAEKQVEANATLDINGVKGSIDPATKFTKVLKYNSYGLLTDGYDARGVRTQFAYDGLNRLSTVTYSGETGYQTPSVAYTYDQARSGHFNTGALTTVTTAAVGDTLSTATEFDYDLMGRVVKQRQSIGTQTYSLEYGYNLAGQLTSEKYPSGRIVTSSYDADGRLSGIADGSRTYLSGLQYQGKGGALSSLTLGNGTTQTFNLNDRFQMEQQELKKGSEVLQKYDYGYGQIDPNNGNLDTTKNNGQLGRIESHIGTAKQWTQRFSYDSIGRLSQSEEKRGDTNALTYKQTFDFDRFGNMYRKSANNGTSGQANPLPFTPIEDSDISKSSNWFTTNTTYDDAGNVVTDNKFRTMGFSYDANGRMVKATKPEVPDALSVYDALGNRIATKTDDVWQFVVYDAFGKMITEYGGLQSNDEGGVRYVMQDWQGSPRTVVSNSGYVQARTDFSAFGEEIQAGIGLRTAQQGYGTANSFRQGYGLTEKDGATGLNHAWFRKNENQAGRWTSPDPYDGSASNKNPQSFNRYSYVENQPTNFVDPSGLLMQTCELRGGEIVCNNSYGGYYYRSWDINLGREGQSYHLGFYFPTFGGYTPRVRGDTGFPLVATGDDEHCDHAAESRLKRQLALEERKIVQEEFSVNTRDLVEAGINSGICLGGLVAAVIIKNPAAVTTALTGCGLAVGVGLGARIATSAARIGAANLRTQKKLFDMNCGEAGVIKSVLKKIGIL